MVKKEEIEYSVKNILISKYNLEINDNDKILLNTKKIKGIDILYIIFLVQQKYNIIIDKYWPFYGEVTIDNIVNYIYYYIK
ncbi:MAG: hypothetical protein PHW36_01360 [Bacilli bacterium]|nr:hypothetical protein [Bacilli bacterium]